MDTGNNIKNFTAVDIEKYHKGLLSAKEMHDLEKAAMDDPFLGDALEGYAVSGVNVVDDNAELKKRLLQRTESAKVIPLSNNKRNNYKFLKVAAMLLFVAGAAFSIYKFGFNKKAENIAKNEPVAAEDARLTDSAESKNIITVPESTATSAKEFTTDKLADTKNISTKPDAVVNEETIIESDIIKGNGNDGIVSETKSLPPAAPAVPAPVISAEEKRQLAKDEENIKTAGYAKKKMTAATTKERSVDITSADDKITNRAVTTNKRNEDQTFRNQTTNIFRGRIIDQNNDGVPFANVTNLEENTGTYSDANGYFNLAYADSVLNVQVRSVGFESNNVQLRNSVPTNQVILQDDRSSLSEVVITNQKPNYEARANNNKMQLEEPEPVDGWTFYDNYLLNNLQRPKEFKPKPLTSSAEVMVSFEVNKNGEPTSFKIEKSLCNKCDKEAIRLIKEGPKWKSKEKNSRTTVTIPF